MAYLFPVKMRGLGTPDVEAFSSYIQRLALAHGVTAGRLLNQCFAWHKTQNPQFYEVAPAPSAGKLPIYVRPNYTTVETLEVIGCATGYSNLTCGTFASLREVVLRMAQGFADSFRWCPVCMLEFEKMEDPGYFKLLWHLEAITHCPTHCVELVSVCKKCGSRQGFLKTRYDCVKCQQCQASLGWHPNSKDISHSWSINGSDLIELVTMIASDHNLIFPAAGARNVISLLMLREWSKCRSVDFYREVQKECHSVFMETAGISFRSIRTLSLLSGIRIPDLLLGKISESSGVLCPTWIKNLPKDLRSKKRDKHNHDKIINKITQALSKSKATKPPALQEIANFAGVSTGYLQYRHRVLSNEIISAHQAWQKEQQAKKRRRSRELALKFFTGEEGDKRSRKEVFRKIRSETGLPKNVLREEINSVYKTLFYLPGQM